MEIPGSGSGSGGAGGGAMLRWWHFPCCCRWGTELPEEGEEPLSVTSDPQAPTDPALTRSQHQAWESLP